MMVLVLTASPTGLRGDLTKWLLEVSPGVFVGNVNVKIREKLWKRVTSLCKEGRALLVYSSNNEQGLEFLVHDHSWEPIDVDGVALMRRPAAKQCLGVVPGGVQQARNVVRDGRFGSVVSKKVPVPAKVPLKLVEG